MGSQEIELKLRLPAAAVRRLTAHPLLRAGPRPAIRELYSVYYDTPHLDLRRSGVALRLRRDGRRWVQTVKGGGSVAGGLHQRLEIECDLARQAIDWASLGRGPYAGLFASRRLQGRLQPVFATRFIRTEHLVQLQPGLMIAAALDRGEITGGGRHEPICELALELRAGPAAALYDFALELAQSTPLTPENRSKAERGYALCRGEAPQPVKARPAVLDAGMTVAAAFGTILRSTLDHLQANEAGMVAGKDPEYLHQMRVALRRMRSAFRVFGPVFPKGATAPMVADMRWLAGALGPARDWDVFTSEILPQFAGRIRERAARAAFERSAKRRRREANRAARRAVDSARYRRFILSFGAWLAAGGWARGADRTARRVGADPVGRFASATLEQRHSKARKRGRKLAAQGPAQRHRLRIAIKKLRYAGDFFSGLYARQPARRMLRQLSGLQDILGAMNDAAQAERMTAGCGARLRGGAVAAAGRALAAWNRSHAPALRRKLKRAWVAFRAQKRFW